MIIAIIANLPAIWNMEVNVQITTDIKLKKN